MDKHSRSTAPKQDTSYTLLEKINVKGGCCFRINTNRQQEIDSILPGGRRGISIKCSHAIAHELGFKASYVYGKIEELYSYFGKKKKLLSTGGGRTFFMANPLKIRKELALSSKSLSKALNSLCGNGLVSKLEGPGIFSLRSEKEAHKLLRIKLAHLRFVEVKLKLSREEIELEKAQALIDRYNLEPASFKINDCSTSTQTEGVN
jgi:hypothetical protein